MGSVRLFERHVRTDPPRREELQAIEAEVARQLATAAPLSQRSSSAITLVGVAGTVTTLKSIELELEPYDPARVHGAVLTLGAVEALCAKLASLPLEERKQLPGLNPKRADVIVAGAIIVRDLLRRAGAAETIVSDRGVRFGLLEKLLSV
jgi:exopolyphosphatase/guanosine-5'-triphosphate,3'-diphosphate pyrophosphatase